MCATCRFCFSELLALQTARFFGFRRLRMRPAKLTQQAAFARLRLAAGSAKLAELQGTCRSGGIGRRAWFRSTYSQGCGGSSPFFGTNIIKTTT